MAKVEKRGTWEVTLHTLAAVLGTLPPAVLVSACLARFLPLTEASRFAMGFTLAIPLWVTAMCVTFLARRILRAWLWCGALGLVFGVFLYRLPN